MAPSPLRQRTSSAAERVRAGVCALARRGDSESGQAFIEFALVLPVLVLLVMGIIDFGFAFNGWDTAQNAAREAARVAAVDPNAADIESRARASSSLLNQSNLAVVLACSTDNGATFNACPEASAWKEGDIVRVKVSYAYRFATPLPRLVGIGSTMAEQATAEARFEGQ